MTLSLLKFSSKAPDIVPVARTGDFKERGEKVKREVVGKEEYFIFNESSQTLEKGRQGKILMIEIISDLGISLTFQLCFALQR